MKKLSLFFCLFFIAEDFVFSQANAGPDKTVSNGVGTKIGTPDDKKSCYHWEATPADPSLKDVSMAQPEVNPSQTTTYKLTVTGVDFSTISTDEVTVFKFDIEYFRHSAGKEWKVVVGEQIEYSATASADCKDWDWDMEDGFPDTWNPEGGTLQKGTLKIPVSDMPGNNSSFGTSYGTVNVSCEDNDGNTHQINSTDLTPPQKASVFYLKNETNNPGGSTPNWFYYWEQFIPMDRIGNLAYSKTLSGYGATDPKNRKTEISDLSSELNDETGHRGLHTFYETIAHENYHIVLWEGWWGAGGSPDPADDVDGDEYPDSWERTNPEAIAYGFAVGFDDSYSSGGAGYKYEEDKCRAVEKALSQTVYDRFDWSYDPTGVNQGKQW